MESVKFSQFILISSFLILLLAQISTSQTLCQLVISKNQSQPFANISKTTKIFINNFSSNKCLRVANFGHFSNSKIFLDECSWWKNASSDQTYTLAQQTKSSIPDGYSLQMPTGLRSESNCMTIQDGSLYTGNCRPSSLDQLWKFKPIRGNENQFLIQQASSSKCIIPKTLVTTSSIKLVPCNSYETEQIWKLCQLS